MTKRMPGPFIAGSTLPLAPVTTTDVDAWRTGLDALARGGFDCVDVVDSWLPFGNLTAAQVPLLAGAVAASGLRLAGLSSIRRSVIDPVDSEANLAYTHRAIDVSAALSAPVLSIGFHRPLTPLQREWAFWTVPGPTENPDDPDIWGLAIRKLRELAEHAGAVGVSLSLELYEDTLLGSGALAARLVECVGSASLGINADLANLYRVPRRLSESWLEAFSVCLPYLNYWHVKNYRRTEGYPDGPFLAWPTQLADGDIDYRLLLRMAIEAGYTGPICIEQYGGDGLSAQSAGLRYLTELLAEARRSQIDRGVRPSDAGRTS
jgi:sugar phosphate isomerase/epimerase